MPLSSIATLYSVTRHAINRNITIVSSVVLFHALALWALQTGLLRRVTDLLVPPEILVEVMVPSAPATAPPTEAPRVPSPAPAPVPRPPMPVKAPRPVALPTPPVATESAPASTTPAAAATTATPANAGTTGTVTPFPAGSTTGTASRVDLPSSDADYLHNPKPPYPPLSKRLGEQGKVVVRVLIGADGSAQKAEIRQSSGFDRLDQSALTTALRWRYLPGKRAGVPEAMWFNVPFNFVLE